MFSLTAKRLATALLLTFSSALLSAQIIYVDSDAAGANDGSSWADAYIDLQDALTTAPPNSEIWVAEGIYLPGDSVEASFMLRKRVALYGGFKGSESSRNERNWETHPSILSGDLNQDDVYGTVVWYSGWNINTPNAIHVVQAINVDRTAVLDGFTVTAGYNAFAAGGGMYAVAGEGPLVANTIFLRNETGFSPGGGGAYVYDCSPRFEGCTFRENYVHLCKGGGLFSGGTAQPEVDGCLFEGNIGVGSSGSTVGGGWCHYGNLPIAVYRSTFRGNEIRDFYSAASAPATGGGLFNFGDSLLVESCVFENNEAHAGGGIFTYRSGHQIRNSFFVDNRAFPLPSPGGVVDYGDYGAGYAMHGPTLPTVAASFLHCTFVNNTAGEGAGIYGNSLDVVNSVFYGNVGTGEDVPLIKAQASGDVEFHYSLVEGIFDSIPGEDPPNPADFPGCLDLDPGFVDALAGDFRPGAGSPLIDAADATRNPADMLVDLAGNARNLDDPATPDTGYGPAPLPDMGAWEFTQPCSPASVPSALLSSPVNPSKAALQWATLSGADGYQIQGGPVGGGTGLLVVFGTSRTVGGLIPGGSYAWRVRARCSADASITAWSLHDTFTLPTARLIADLGVLVRPGIWELPSLTDAQMDGRMIIVDLAGRIHYAGAVRQRIHTVGWPAGMYTVSISDESGALSATAQVVLTW